MNYTLAVLTHGEGDTLDTCLESFGEYVKPLPNHLTIMRDGPGYSYIPSWRPPSFYVGQIAPEPEGFCRAARALWDAVSRSDHDYVFWLEHDFVFTRDLDLRYLAAVLDTEPQLAQMALMRDAVNPLEKNAGGLYEHRRKEYTPRESIGGQWLCHRSYFTTNPSLMRRDFMAANPWQHEEHCEGMYGIDLVKLGYVFGVWGDGSPWVTHIGERTGFGY